MNFPFSVISGKICQRIINNNRKEIYKLIKDIYINHEDGNTINPKSYFLKFPDKPQSRIIALPAAIKNNPRVAGIKWISSNPLNINHGFPRASAVIILNNYDSGYPYACIEASTISATRTAYSAAIAAECLFNYNKNIKTLGIIGCGFIAQSLYECLRNQEWQVDQISVFDKNEENAFKFSEKLSSIVSTPIHVEKNYLEVIIKSDLLLFSTTASESYITDLSLFSHNPKILHISLRDLGVPIILSSYNIVDDIEHVLSYETSLHLAEKNCGNRNFITGTLGSVIKNKHLIDFEKPTIFSPMGMGIFDIALGQFIYEKVRSEKADFEIADFFSYS